MRITTKLVVNIETGEILHHSFYEYFGLVDKTCGGDALAPEKEAAAKAQADAAAQQAAIAKQRNDVQQPFETSRVNGGLPYLSQLLDYSGGVLAQQYAPQRASMNRSLAGFGSTLPSGFATQTQTDFDSNEANAFDTNVINGLEANEATKENAAAQLNPLGYYSGSTGANSSILSAPPVNSGGVGNFLGGLASAFVNKASVTGGPNGITGFSL